IPTSLQACGIIFPFAVPTSICRNKLTICSAVYFFPRPISSSSHTSLPHIHWYKICRALHIGADKGWHMKPKHADLRRDSLFYCFVDFVKGPESRPVTYVVPSRVIADVLSYVHPAWLAVPGK